MKISQWLQFTLLTTASFFTVGAFSPSRANNFGNTEVNADNFVAVAAPFGSNQHQLVIIEQISNRRACWRENGSNPVRVDPLLLNFDFTGICGRSLDSNGYSIRMNGQDLGLDYMLRLIERDGELLLLGTPIKEHNAPEIEIGSSRGINNGFQKIFLNPGWRFTRRTYQGRRLGHIYLTNDSSPPVQTSRRGTSRQLRTRPRTLPATSARELPPPAFAEDVIVPPPQRELIFTKPRVEPSAAGGEWSENNSQTVPLLVPEREIPVFGN
ncbi:MAG: DUF3747 domain-containing protein [Symploca sp. SIO2E9]|nr:DUF3747 domain-containing protein [Symploca sp. SIO2E9]